MKDNTLTGPWKACLNVPGAVIPGHIVKVDDDVEFPVASIWKGGGTHGEKIMRKVVHLVAAAPDLLAALKEVTMRYASYAQSNTPEYRFVKQARAAIAKAEGKKPKAKKSKPRTTAK